MKVSILRSDQFNASFRSALNVSSRSDVRKATDTLTSK